MSGSAACARLVISGTGTGVGKTTVARSIVRRWSACGLRVAALKPFETGVEGRPRDALALAMDAGHPELADLPDLYRAAPPLAPAAISRALDVAAIVAAVRDTSARFDVTVVEGIGGIAVPLDDHRLFADFAAMLGWPIVVVARDELGVLSHVLAALEVARARRLAILGVVLTRAHVGDVSTETNAAVLARLAGTAVQSFDIDAPDSGLADDWLRQLHQTSARTSP